MHSDAALHVQNCIIEVMQVGQDLLPVSVFCHYGFIITQCCASMVYAVAPFPSICQLLLLHPFNRLFSRTSWESRHQKSKPFCILLEQEMMGWQCHQLDHMQIICTSLQTDNHARTSPLSFYTSDALPAAKPTASKHGMKIPPIRLSIKSRSSINTAKLASPNVAAEPLITIHVQNCASS